LAYVVYRSTMKQNQIQQQILLMLGTSFLSRECLEKDDCSNKNHLTEKEKLEQACWNGLLHEMLPEIVEQTEDGEKLYLYQIKTVTHFFELELGQSHEQSEAQFSLDPYRFLAIKCRN
jgi:hypothetical protein